MCIQWVLNEFTPSHIECPRCVILLCTLSPLTSSPSSAAAEKYCSIMQLSRSISLFLSQEGTVWYRIHSQFCYIRNSCLHTPQDVRNVHWNVFSLTQAYFKTVCAFLFLSFCMQSLSSSFRLLWGILHGIVSCFASLTSAKMWFK